MSQAVNFMAGNYVTLALVEQARGFASYYKAIHEEEAPQVSGVIASADAQGILLNVLLDGLIPYMDDLQRVEEEKMTQAELEQRHFEPVFVTWNAIIGIH